MLQQLKTNTHGNPALCQPAEGFEQQLRALTQNALAAFNEAHKRVSCAPLSVLPACWCWRLVALPVASACSAMCARVQTLRVTCDGCKLLWFDRLQPLCALRCRRMHSAVCTV